MTHWRVTWEFNSDGNWEPAIADIPGGEFGKHGAREFARGVAERETSRSVVVQKSEDGVEWEDVT